MFLCALATLYDPGGISPVSPIDRFLLPATKERVSASTCYPYGAESLHTFVLWLSHFAAYA